MTNHNRPKFKLGKTVITPGGIDALSKSNQLPDPFLNRHITGDWGDICQEDAELNNQAIAHEGEEDKQMRVMSVYKTNKNETIWIITEWDRSVTTILLPNEY
ncbi:MAG: hypothetical protein FVQ82_10325 [Planctomycetes bacterium]|nr:hypothetical protein [Planctomycetota bacterium]